MLRRMRQRRRGKGGWVIERVGRVGSTLRMEVVEVWWRLLIGV